MGKMKYILSKMSILGCFLCIIGAIFTIQGIIARYNLANIKESYSKFEIKNGRYIEYDISKKDLIGSYYTNPGGSIGYGPYCAEFGYIAKQTYIVSINEKSNYYVPLVVTDKYIKKFSKTSYGDESYHIFGKFEKLAYPLDYEMIAKCVGTDNRPKIDALISSCHQIRIVNLEDEKKILYKGLSFLIMGLLIFLFALEKERRKLDTKVDNTQSMNVAKRKRVTSSSYGPRE